MFDHHSPIHLITGQHGEEQAIHFLKSKGYQVLTTNFRGRSGEIDIIAQDADVIVFVEVKTRRSDEFGHPSEAVTKSKLDKLNKTAEKYLKLTKLENDYRFDIISILPGKIDHFENVTMG